MGFEDTFGREQSGKSDLQYDDTAFSFFFVAVLTSIAFPLGLSILRPLVFNPLKSKLSQSCQCEACKKKAKQIFNQNKNKFIDKWYKAKIITLFILIIVIKTTYRNIDQEASTIKKFDPYSILELEEGADKDAIKKAYRRLSRMYHPDKAKDDPEATAKFIFVGKAYECLTDEKKKDLCAKYGNPDGPGKMNVAIAMPSFLLKKENHISVLFVFFLLILVVLPTIGICWYRDQEQVDNNGVKISNQRGFYERLNENLIMRNCPEVLAQSLEYLNISINKEQAEELEKMLKNLEKEADKFSDKKLGEKFRHRYTASYTIICAHLLGYPIPKVLKGIHKRVVTKAPFILQSMIQFINSHPFLFRRMPQREGQQRVKFLGVQPLVKIIEFQQMMVQGLWYHSERYPDIFQLSYFTDNPAERRNKKLPKLKELLNQEEQDRKLSRWVLQGQEASVNAELNKLPKIKINVFCGVEGEDEITDEDFFQIKVTIERQNLKEKEENRLVHAVQYPSFRFEKWHFILSTEKNDVVNYQLVSGEKKMLECKYQTRFPVGKYFFILYVKSDSYRGYDLEQELRFEVKSHTQVKRTITWHEEDQALDKQSSVYSQMMAQMNPKQEDSEDDEEEEEEPLNKKNNLQPKKKENESDSSQ